LLLARLYEQGNGVATNTTEALKYFRLSANAGNAEAQCALGNMLAKSGTTSDLQEASTNYRKASNSGHLEAKAKLGTPHHAMQICCASL